MRFIVVDVGNTSTALGLWCDGVVLDETHCDDGFSEASRIVDAILEREKNASDFTRAIAFVSVVPSVLESWQNFAASRNLRFHNVSANDLTSKSNAAIFSLDYPKPETIGADRLADAAGAIVRFGAPVLVMDFGTALTAAVVTRDKIWRGGVIAPGFPLMRDYLFERTAQLPRMQLGFGDAPKIGKSTEDAMRFGALVGYRGMVREIVSTLTKNFDENFQLVATGGFASWALKNFDMPFKIDTTLTLFGAGVLCLDYFKN